MEDILYSQKLDVLLGTESHLEVSVLDSEIFSPNFLIYRKDQNKFGGGVFIAVHYKIPSYQIYTDTPLEIIWVRLHISSNSDIIFGSFYRPPNSPTTALNDLNDSLRFIRLKFPCVKNILGGDFNCPGIDWHTGTLTDSYVSVSLRESLMELADDYQLQQTVTFPTRQNNLLDLCFTSHIDLVQSCQPYPGLCDHEVVLIKFQSQIPPSKQHSRKIYLYQKANWNILREKLNLISNEYFLRNQSTIRDVEDNWQFIHHHILKLIDVHIPTKLLHSRSHCPWLTTPLKRLIRKKQRTYNYAKYYNDELKWKEYKELSQKVCKLLRQQHTNYLTNILSTDVLNNRKLFWKYVKSKRKDSVGISTLKTPDGCVVSNSLDKSEILNNQFKSVFTIENTENFPNKGPSPFPKIGDTEITTTGVYKLLSNCHPWKSPGPDNIHACFLKNTAREMAPMLTHLYQLSLTTAVLPKIWKEAYVTPIYKAGERTDPKNYRPISLTSLICKFMEHIICSQLMHHLDTNNILTECQFGFRSHHSCESQLLITIDDFAKAINNRQQIDVGILDFAKAFDKVPHSRLLYKLEYYGVTGNLLKWLTSFLSDRSQQVALNGVLSSRCNVTSGVRQGSVLGPTLFLVYINDIASIIQSKLHLFADDCIIYRTINSPTDHAVLQQDFDTLTRWAKSWQMEFNVHKCNILQISNIHDKSTFPYMMYNTPLKYVVEHKYLGVWLNGRLSWHSHISYTCHKVNRTLGFLQRNLKTCPTHLKEHAYKQMVLPLLEYCASI